jgi:hypothetical protein
LVAAGTSRASKPLHPDELAQSLSVHHGAVAYLLGIKRPAGI